MATFPRTLLPNQVATPRVPGGLMSVGQTGGVQLRSNVRAGRSWVERWWALQAASADVEALISFIEQHHNEAATFDILHQTMPGCGNAPNGSGLGTPLVNGASEAGDTIATDGWTINETGVIRIGDCFTIAGLNQLFRLTTADASSNGSGQSTLDINPPILVGSSPANNAALTLVSNTMRAVIMGYDMPPMDAAEFISLTVQFREAP